MKAEWPKRLEFKLYIYMLVHMKVGIVSCNYRGTQV